MSRGYDIEGDDDRGYGEAHVPNTGLEQSGIGRGGSTANKRGRRESGNRELPAGRKTSVRAIEKWQGLSERERGTLREIGRFRTIDADALLKHRYQGKAAGFNAEIARLKQQGLIQRRSISVGKNRNTLVVLALTEKAATLVRGDSELPSRQAIYAGFVKPAEVPHDAAIYKMYQAEAGQIEAAGGNVRRVVLDYEFKREIYSKLAPERDLGAIEYARRQREIAGQHDLPVVEGKIALPDLRIEYETADGELDHVDLELATEHYRPGHMQLKARAGFKMYGFVSTSRGRRAQWEGQELTASVLSL